MTCELNGKEVTWHPGMADTGNLHGTTRTLDGALGGKTKDPMDPGLISRDGWVLVDDSNRSLFDGNDSRFDQGKKSKVGDTGSQSGTGGLSQQAGASTGRD